MYRKKKIEILLKYFGENTILGTKDIVTIPQQMAMSIQNINIYGDVHFHIGETTEKKSHGNIQDACRTIVDGLNNLILEPKMPPPPPPPTSNKIIIDTIIDAVKNCEELGIQARNKNIYKYCVEKIPQFVACVNCWESDIRVRCQWMTIDKSWIDGNCKMSETAFDYLYNVRKETKLWRVKRGVYKTVTPEEKQNLNISYHSDSNYKYIVITYNNKKIEFKKNKTCITKTILM